MQAVALIATIAASMYLIMLRLVTRELTHSPLAWRLLAWSGIPLALGGLGFAVRFWRPSSGPYVANQLYPFGGHLQAWAVSFGFTWLAFGLLFTGAVVCASHRQDWPTWALLLTSWCLCWLPHLIIGIGFALYGANRQSVRFYEKWARDPGGAIILASSSLVLVWHFAFSIAGFIGTARGIHLRHLTPRPNST
jgi:hypothetical protein